MAKRLGTLPYLLNKQLPSGSYAEVFEATSRDQVVVVKIARAENITGGGATRPRFASCGVVFQTGLAGDWDPEPNEVIAAEARLLQSIDHPAFPHVLASGVATIDGAERQYLVMEKVAGRTWREALGEKARPTLEQFRALLAALLEVSGRLPFHGDIKPDNVILGEDARVHIVDPSSGLAQRTGDSMTHLLATPEYNPTFEASDLPALGMLLLETLSGQHPLAAPDTTKASRSISLELNNWLRQMAAVGHSRVTKLYPLILLPSDVDEKADRDLEKTALRCLGLTLNPNGVLDLAEPFSSLAELERACHELRA